MKYIFLFLISLYSSIEFVYAQEQIPNSNFEQWSNDYPDVWNNTIRANGITLITAKKTTNAYSGSYGVELQTKQIITGDVIPGMIQLGYFDLKTKENKGGIPFSSRPTAFRVYLKYDHQQSTDSLIVYCELTKYDKNLHKTIKISESWFTHNQNIDNYTSFEFPIYYKTNDNPDTINIGFASSGSQLHIGSTLFVDNLTLEYNNHFFAPTVDFPINATDTSFDALWNGSDSTNFYYLDVASDKNFTHHLPDFLDRNVGDTNIYHISIGDTSIKEVYYRVKANYDSIVSDYSETMQIAIPYIPVSLEPTKVTSKYFVAKWKPISSAKYYIFDVARDSNFTDFVPGYYFFKTSSNTVNVVGLQRDTKYYYRVRAGYLGLKSLYSNTIEVTTAVSDYGDLIQFFTLPDKLLIYTNKDIYKSEFYLYDIHGAVFWHGKLETRYTEIPLRAIEMFIFVAYTPKGIIKKKIGVSDMGSQ